MRIGILTELKQDGKEHYSTKRYREEIEARGHEAVLTDCTQTAVALTEEGRILYEYDRENEWSLRKVEVDAVIPDFDKYSAAGCLALHALTSHGIPTTNDPEAILRSHDKFKTHIILDKHGIPTPYGVMPAHQLPIRTNDILRIIECDPERPGIIKINEASRGQGTMLGESRRSLRSIVEALDIPTHAFFIQEFIEAPRPVGRHSSIGIFVIDQEVVASFKLQANNDKEERDFRTNLSLGGEGEDYTPSPRESEIALHAMKAIDLDLGRVDVMPSDRGPLVTDINALPGYQIEHITGENIAGQVVSYVDKKYFAAHPHLQPDPSLKSQN